MLKNIRMARIMRRIFLLILVIIAANGAVAEELINRMVGPGIRHRSFYLKEGPWAINILEIDLTNPYIDIESVKAQDRLMGYEQTSSMASRTNRNGHWVVGAINGDFFATGGVPINCQVVNNKLLKIPSSHSVIGFYTDLKPFIEILQYSGAVLTKIRQNHAIDGINRNRNTDELIFYSSFFGPNTQTNIWGAEIRFRPVTTWAVNDTFRVVVIGVDYTQGNQAIPANGGVLSGHGAVRDWLLHRIAVGDTLKIILQLQPIKKKVKEVVGGLPRIIRDGNTSIEEGGGGFENIRHPRTGVGFSQDSTKLFFFAVDGRQSGYSDGMTLYEMADFLKPLGVYQAVNLDGGGSTTMVVRNKIVNSPSDAGGERSVANALLVISKAPLDTLLRLNILTDSLRIFQGETYQFQVEGFDPYYNPFEAAQLNAAWSCDSQLGTIDPITGWFTAGNRHLKGDILVQSGAIRDTAAVIVDVPAHILVQSQQLFLTPGDTLRLAPQLLDTGGKTHNLLFAAFSWHVTDSIVTVSSEGVLVARDKGAAILTLGYDSLSLAITISVGVPGSATMEDFAFAPTSWQLGYWNAGSENSFLFAADSICHSATRALGFRYQYPGNSGSAAYSLLHQVQIPDHPDRLTLWIYPGGNPLRMRGYFTDAGARSFTQYFLQQGNSTFEWQNEWRPVQVDFSQVGGNPLFYPITLKEVRIYFSGGTAPLISGTLFIDDLQADYFTDVDFVCGQMNSLPEEFLLLPGFPNPCTTKSHDYHVQFQLNQPGSLTLTIYNLLGQNIVSFHKQLEQVGTHQFIWDGRNRSGILTCSGVYLADLQYLGKHFRQKLLLID